jgi:segregation and condensation protein A
MNQTDDMFLENEAEASAPIQTSADFALTIDIDGWEGPLDLLLTLARNQKVDLRQISILQLVEQYLHFIENARALKLELAADYLVMAAWLAYLKSALLLPKDPTIDPSPEELALRLQLRLERLNAMRDSGARLMARDRIGRDVFVRGKPEGLRVVRTTAWAVNYFDLISAYGEVQARSAPVMHVVKRRAVMTLEDALERVSILVGQALDWTSLEAFLPKDAGPLLRRSALASSFLAMLELAKRGKIDLMQDENFAPLMVRMKKREFVHAD